MNDPKIQHEALKLLTEELREVAVYREFARLSDAMLSYGPDEYPDGTILRIKKTFSGERWFTYAAVKADERWWLTGSSPKNQTLTWEQLVLWLVGEGQTVYADKIERWLPDAVFVTDVAPDAKQYAEAFDFDLYQHLGEPESNTLDEQAAEREVKQVFGEQ